MKALWNRFRSALAVLLALAHLMMPPARADLANPNFMPIGERSAFLGNTGVGANRQTEGVYYNPASLADLLDSEISVTGSVYFQFKIKIDPVMVLDSENIPYESTGFNSVPSTLVSTMKLGDRVVAISTLVPDALQTETNAHFETENYEGVLMPYNNENELWIGASIADRLSPKWSLGLSLFLAQHNKSEIQGAGFVHTPSNTILNTHSRVRTSTMGLVPILGVHFTASRRLQFGLRVRAPYIPLTGTGSAESLSTANQTTVEDETFQITESKAHHRIPADFTLGTVIRPIDDLDLLVDVGYQLGTRFDPLPANPTSKDVHTVPKLRVHAGMEVRAFERLPFRIGGFYTPSTRDKSSHDIRADFYGVTGGINLQSGKHVKTGLGAFFVFGEGKLRRDDGGTSDVALRGRGALLTTSYLF